MREATLVGSPPLENDGARKRVIIAGLNDAFRTSFVGGRVIGTRAVAAMSDDARAALLQAVRAFDTFTPDNDSYGEHDFGAIEIGGETYFWKIDPFDIELEGLSPDPSDPAVTRRVLTVMLAEEY